MTSASVFLVMVFYAIIVFMKAIVVNRTIQFEDPMKIYTVLQGERVSLLCSPDDIGTMNIFTKRSQLVTSGRLKKNLSDEFDLECHQTSCTLSIKQVEKKHADMYTCYLPQTSLTIEVISSPSQDYPVCNSSHTNNTFFLDSFQEPFNFNCLSEEAIPPVNISLSVNRRDGDINNKTNEHFTIYKTNDTVLLSYSSYLDSSFNNSTFVCTVTQPLPAPYHSYNKSCSFGPLMLPVFSVWIHPSHYTITTKSRENITLMCTSNVSGVVLEWTNIPLEDWDYNITRINDSLQLNIFDYGSSIDLPITIQCSGSYAGRTVSQYATIDSASTDEHGLSLGLVMLLIVFVIVSAIVIVTGVLIIRKRKKQHPSAMSLSNTGQTYSPNDNNANNINVGHDEVNDDRHSSLNDAASNMIQDGTEMVDNPIYGSNRKQNSDFGRISDGSNSSIEMTGNVVYESYKPKTLRMEENKEEGNYAIVSVKV